MDEANKNSQALSRLADEIAAAKKATDEALAGFEGTRDKLMAEIEAREESENTMYETADRLRYEAETEVDEQAAKQRWVFVEQAELAIEKMHQDNEEAH